MKPTRPFASSMRRRKFRGRARPDFKVTKSGMILGYVETKALGENLAKVRKSDQIAPLSDALRQHPADRLCRMDVAQKRQLCADRGAMEFTKATSKKSEIPPAGRPRRRRFKAGLRILLLRTGRHRPGRNASPRIGDKSAASSGTI